MEQFRRLMNQNPSDKSNSPTGDCPVTNVSWYEAVEYCNRLSKKEGIDKAEWCYLPNTEGNYGPGMEMAPNYLQRKGYRLPTEAEWEFACRAGAESKFSFGESDELLGKNGWFALNSYDKTHPTGSLRPNDFGLFDMHGNAWEWCQDEWEVRKAQAEGAIDDKEDTRSLSLSAGRVLRGGSFFGQASLVRSAVRNFLAPAYRSSNDGFRVARTLPLDSFTALRP